MKIIKFLFSEILMGILLIIFAVAIGYATFIENDFDAIAGRAAEYNARWFELLMLLMVINFSGLGLKCTIPIWLPLQCADFRPASSPLS